MKKVVLLSLLSLLLVGCSMQEPLILKSDDKQELDSFESVPAALLDVGAMEITESVVNEVTQSSVTTHPGDYQGHVWWIAPDGFNIFINETPGASIGISARSVEEFSSVFDKTVALVDAAFDSKDFTVNKKNSSEAMDDQTFYDYVRAYENIETGIVCTLVLDGDSYQFPLQMLPADDPGFRLSCTSKFVRSYNEQVPFLKGLKKESQKTVTISGIEKMIGDFALVNIHGRRAGTAVFMKKQNGIYRSLYETQEVPPCSIVDTHRIPKGIYGICYLDNGTDIRE